MVLLAQETLPGEVTAVRVSADGSIVAVLYEEMPQLALFSITKASSAVPLLRLDTRKLFPYPVRDCDLAFDPDDNSVLLIGYVGRVVGRIVEELLCLVRFSPSDPGSAKHVLVEAVVPYFCPCFTGGKPSVLLVGTGSGVICFDPVELRECGRLECEDDWPGPTGILFDPHDSSVFVVWMYQAGCRVSSYHLGGASGLETIQEGEDHLNLQFCGAALMPGGERLVLTLCTLGFVSQTREQEQMSDRILIGSIAVFDTSTVKLLCSMDVMGAPGKDYDRRPIQVDPGQVRVPFAPVTSVCQRRDGLSNPVVIDHRIAYGMPGGAVLLLDIGTGQQEVLMDCNAPVTSLAYASATGLLCVGCKDGSIYFLSMSTRDGGS